MAASGLPLSFPVGLKSPVPWWPCSFLFHLKYFPRHLGIVPFHTTLYSSKDFFCFDLVIDEPCSLFPSADFGKVRAWWHMLGGKEQGNSAYRREDTEQSGRLGGWWIIKFVDKPDWCCSSIKLVCDWQVSVLEILLLEDSYKISMMATPGEALLRSGKGVWCCRNT